MKKSDEAIANIRRRFQEIIATSGKGYSDPKSTSDSAKKAQFIRSELHHASEVASKSSFFMDDEDFVIVRQLFSSLSDMLLVLHNDDELPSFSSVCTAFECFLEAMKELSDSSEEMASALESESSSDAIHGLLEDFALVCGLPIGMVDDLVRREQMRRKS